MRRSEDQRGCAEDANRAGRSNGDAFLSSFGGLPSFNREQCLNAPSVPYSEVRKRSSRFKDAAFCATTARVPQTGSLPSKSATERFFLSCSAASDGVLFADRLIR